MGSVPNAVRRGGIFHFRRAIPGALQPLFNRAELTCSLRTANVAQARRLSRALYVCTEELFDAVRTAPMLSERDIAALVKDFYGSILAQDEAVRFLGRIARRISLIAAVLWLPALITVGVVRAWGFAEWLAAFGIGSLVGLAFITFALGDGSRLKQGRSGRSEQERGRPS